MSVRTSRASYRFTMLPRSTPPRVVVENVLPRVDEGATPIRRVPGDVVDVSADVFAEGSEGVRAGVRWCSPGASAWDFTPMEPMPNDRWTGRFVVEKVGAYRFEVVGWIDPFLTWRRLLLRRIEAGSATPADVREGGELLRTISGRVPERARGPISRLAEELSHWVQRPLGELRASVCADFVEQALCNYPGPEAGESSGPLFTVRVDPLRAQHSAWYEVFPRSTSPRPGQHGTWADLRARLPYIAELGFDVVYLPPIHPIGRVGRRGPNNSSPPPPNAPGSPWAIGATEGGHTSVHPALGDLHEFTTTVEAARKLGLDVALDLAFQCAPDHPWVHEHPEWFARRPDGTIRTAENPPKKYEDIYPLDFSTKDWTGLWAALKEVVDFWIARGVRWFRVDNPHTKPFEFWRWLIGEVRADHPDVMFLAEAFTRPKLMYQLAKVGFTHSYTYFAWRTDRSALEQYFRELSTGEVAEFFRPHLWPNTPDILTEQFHSGQRSVFVHRLVLAATLSSHYGIYGPAYELMEHAPLEAGKEEYRNSEKYEIRHWDLQAPESLAPEIRRLNQIRREHAALRTGRALTFHAVDNDHLLAFSRRTDDGSDVILVIVNLDPSSIQAGWTALDLDALRVDADDPFVVHDLWGGEDYTWRGPRNFVRLDPHFAPVHILHVPRSGSRREAAGRTK
ncbi:MAG: maltotransferase domain-containing protein [Thermoplasmata archaeon]